MAAKKANIFDYIEWRGDLRLSQSPFNEIDGLILSVLSYLDFSYIKGVPLNIKTAARRFNKLPKEFRLNGPVFVMESDIELFNLLGKSERFCDISIGNYVNKIDEEKEMQFSATCFYLSDDTVFVSFRGTDNTFVGWKEDFNMSFSDGVPAQLTGARYVEDLMKKTDRKFRLGGHSKGGNLAVWAGASLSKEYRDRLIAVYSNDGPGFIGSFLNSEGYLSIRDRVMSFVPESSIVGVLMNHDQYTTIASLRPSLLQHDPFSWVVSGAHFVTDNTRTKSGEKLEKAVNSWMWSMTETERAELIESLYSIITTSKIKTLDDIDRAKIKSVFSMQKAFSELGKDKQSIIFKSFLKLIFNGEQYNGGKPDRLITQKD